MTTSTLYFKLHSYFKDSSGKFIPVGIDAGHGDTLPVRLGYDSTWKSVTEKVPPPERNKFYLSIDGYSVVPNQAKTDVIAVKPPQPETYWFSTVKEYPPGSGQYATIWELPGSDKVWTVEDPKDAKSKIVLKSLKSPLEEAQLFKLSVVE